MCSGRRARRRSWAPPAAWLRPSSGSGCSSRRGETLSYSAPLAPSDWERRADGAGSIVLPSAGGAIGTLVPYRGRLLLFRERGITALAAPGDFLDFEAEEIPYACGKLIPSSVAACGSRVLFCTEEGGFLAQGERGLSRRGVRRGAHRLCSGCAFGCRRGGIFRRRHPLFRAKSAFSSSERSARAFCGWKPRALRVGRELCFLQGGRRYALDRGAAGERAAYLELPLSDFGLSEARYLDAVRVEGEGDFRIEARPQRGLPRFVRGRAGEELRFSPPLRGSSFSLKLRSDSAGAKIAGILLSLRGGESMIIDIIDLTDEQFADLNAVQMAMVRAAQTEKNDILAEAEEQKGEIFRRLLTNGTARSTYYDDRAEAIDEEAAAKVAAVKDDLLYQIAYDLDAGDGNEDGPYRYPENPNYNLSASQRFLVVRSYYMEITSDAEARLEAYAMDTLARSYLGEYYATLYDLLASYI